MLARDRTGALDSCLAVFGPGRPRLPSHVGARATLGAAVSRDAFDLEWSTCDRARIARDPRFDGWFFTGVLTTGVLPSDVSRASRPVAERRLLPDGVRGGACRVSSVLALPARSRT